MSRPESARRLIQIPSVLCAVFLTTACAKSIEANNELQIVNVQDLFSLTVQNLTEVTDTRSYRWENTATQATVQILQAITGGAVLLTATYSIASTADATAASVSVAAGYVAGSVAISAAVATNTLAGLTSAGIDDSFVRAL